MFVQQKNPTTGEWEWAVVGAGDEEGEVALSDLLQSSHYLDMFNDASRNRAYRLAIDEVVKPGDTVLDIGTGTGLLAMLSARSATRRGAGGHVTACEVFEPMARAAESVVAENGLAGCVDIIHKRSDEMSVGAGLDMSRRADVIVTEIFDSELLGEGILPTMRHATAHLLEIAMWQEGGKVIPAGAEIWAQLIESAFLEQMVQQQPSPDGDAFLRPLHLDPLYPDHLRPLSDPFRVFAFDFAHPPAGDEHALIEVSSKESGSCTAVAVWWKLIMDAGSMIVVSTAPNWVPRRSGELHPRLLEQQWRDHWKACWAPLIGGSALGPGRTLRLLWRHYDFDMSVAVAAEPGSCAAGSSGECKAVGAVSSSCGQKKSWADSLREIQSGGQLWGVGVKLPDLWRAQRPLQRIEGFDFTNCNRLLGVADRSQQGFEEVEGKVIWQCGGGCQEITQRRRLMPGNGSTHQQDVSTVLEVEGAAAYIQAVVFWVKSPATAPAEETVERRLCDPDLEEKGLLMARGERVERVRVIAHLDRDFASLQAALDFGA